MSNKRNTKVKPSNSKTKNLGKPRQLQQKPHKIGPLRPQQQTKGGKKIQHARPVYVGNKLVGYGDYTEAKGRALYDKKKAKKKNRKEKSGGETDWWDLAGKAASYLGPLAAKALIGFGDYTVDTNSVSAAATNGALGGEIPMLTNSHCANIVHHREYIGPVNGSIKPFEVTATYDINPGLLNSFPWSNPIAACYTRYRFRGIVYEYEPLTSEFQTEGFIAIGTQYNPLDAPFTDKRTMLNHEFSTAEKPSRVIMHPIECAKNQMSIDEYFIRDGPPPANSDIRFYDLGRVSVAAGGNPSSGQIGDLWATYELEFYQPKMNLGNGEPTFSYSSADCSDSTPFGSDGIAKAGNMSGAVVLGNTFKFPAAITNGLYEVVYTRTGTNVNASYVPYVLTNCQPQVALGYNNASNGVDVSVAVASNLVKVTSTGATITIPNTCVLPEGPGSFTVTKVSPDCLKQLYDSEQKAEIAPDESSDSSNDGLDDRIDVLEGSLKAMTMNLECLTTMLMRKSSLSNIPK